MGCVHSRSSKEQTHSNGDDNHGLMVTLRASTSASISVDGGRKRYSLNIAPFTSDMVKPDVERPAEQAKKESNSWNDMDEKLGSLRSTAPLPAYWDEVNSIVESLKYSEERSKPRPPQRHSMPELLDTIDVADMMRGLEEDKSVEAAPSSNARMPNQPKPLASHRHRVFGKAISFHTIKELDFELGKWKNKDITRGLDSKSNVLFSGLQSGVPHDKVLRSNPQIVSSSIARNPPASLGLGKEIITRRAILARDRSLLEPAPILGPEVTSSPFKRFSSLHGKVKLTFDLECKNNVKESTPLTQDASSPAGSSSSKRAFSDQSDNMSDPGTPIFDPELLASYEKDLEDIPKEEWNSLYLSDEPLDNTSTVEESVMPFEKQPLVQDKHSSQAGASIASSNSKDPLECFEEKCPPGGNKSAVLYTTSLRSVRKTFNECNHVRGVLKSFGHSIDERDVSMDAKFRNELSGLVGQTVPLPRLFIKGRHIGGTKEILELHEEGQLCALLDEELPKDAGNGGNCVGCKGICFMPCLECSGSCKIVNGGTEVIRCSECNENGMIQCPLCVSS